MDKNRQRLIRLLHVAKRDLKMDDDSYRAILMRIGKKTSSADLTIIELEKVLSYFKKIGFKVRAKTKRPPAAPAVSRPLAGDTDSKKIRALWLFLHQLGAVQDPSEKALAAYVRRITKVEALQWINREQAAQLIETLKKWAMRFLPDLVERMAEEAAATLSLSEKDHTALNKVVGTALTRRTYDPMCYAWERLNDALKKGDSHV